MDRFLLSATARCSVLGALLALFSGVPTLALDPSRSAGQHAYRQWRIEEGLPQNTVRAVAQTPDDLLWIATHAGLVRFDGVAFDRVEVHELLDSFHVSSLVVDADGSLWIGTNGGGLLRVRGQDVETFGLEDGLPGLAVLSLATRDGRLWIGTDDRGVALWHEDRFRVWGPEQGIPPDAVHDLLPAADGSCRVVTLGGGVFRIDASGEVARIPGLPSSMTRAVAEEADGTLWVGTHDGVFRRRAGDPDGAWQRFTTADGLPGDRISRLLLDADGNLWVGTLGQGVGRWNGRGFEQLPQNEERRLGVVWSFFEDREGHLWIGTLGAGLLQLFDGPVLPVGRPEGLDSLQAVALHEDEDGVLWIATRDAGVRRYKDGRWLPPITTADGLAHDGAWSLDFGVDGELWLAGFAPSLDRWTPEGTRTITHADGLGTGRVLAVLADRHGDVWASTSSGLSRLHDGRLTTYTTADGLVHNQTLSIVEPPPGSDNGRIWVGSNGGFSVWSEEEGFRSYTSEHGLRNERVWSLLPEKEKGSAWIGTFGGGLHRLRNGRIDLVLHAAHGLPSPDVTTLVDDGRGFLWMATTRGLARLPWNALRRPAQEVLAEPLPVLSLDVRDGMRSAESYGGQPIGIRGRDGRLWFATLDGFVCVDPSAIECSGAPRVVVREVRVDGRPIPEKTDFVLPPDHHRLSVSFTATTLAAPSRIRFRHRLVGLDPTWRDLGHRRLVELSRLPPGKYTFELEAGDAQGHFPEEPTRFSFEVRPRFTQTRAFYFLAALGLIALGLGVQQARVRLLRQREAELQATAEEAIANVRTLRGMLPMCAGCKKIRDDEGYWQGVETYISDHSEAAFSHGLCPTCSTRYMDEFALEEAGRPRAEPQPGSRVG